MFVALIFATATLQGPWGTAPSIAPPIAPQFAQDAPAQQPAPGPDVVIQLRSNTRIKGKILEETDEVYRISTAEFGEISIPRDMVLAVLPADAPLGPPPPAAVAPPPPGLFGTQFLAGWDKSIELGFSGKDGDIDTLDFYGKASGDYADETARWRTRIAYFYGITESDITKNEGFANARRDWLRKDSPWFFWAETRADYNEFKDYRFRAGGFAGLGYAFYDTEKFRLLGRAGVGGSYEFGHVNELTPEALLAAEMRWKVTDNQTFELTNTLFPDLDDFGEYRNFTEAAYTVSLQRGRGLSLKFGLQNEYDSYTEDDSGHNTLTYFGALLFSF